MLTKEHQLAFFVPGDVETECKWPWQVLEYLVFDYAVHSEAIELYLKCYITSPCHAGIYKMFYPF